MTPDQKKSTSPYLAHRRALARRLPDGLILLSGGEMVARNADTDYEFRQQSDFLYLCGVDEPGCALLIDPRRGRQTLFMPRIDNEHRVWLGHMPGPAEARRLYGVAHVAMPTRSPESCAAPGAATAGSTPTRPRSGSIAKLSKACRPRRRNCAKPSANNAPARRLARSRSSRAPAPPPPAPTAR